MTTAENILKNIEKLYQQKYGVAVFNIRIRNVKNEIEINGSVLIEKQRDYIMNVFKNNKLKIKKEKLKILSDASARNEIGWAVVKNKIADLKSRFVSSKIMNDRMLKRIRCSQAFQGEMLRILYKNEDQLLVQPSDLSLGWVNRNEVIIKKKSLCREWIQQFHILGSGSKNKIIIAGVDKTKTIKEIEKYLGAKYVLGGKSENGIDCSGLTQVVYKNVFDIILPRHSWDQKEIGKKVSLENIKTGDLVFLIKKSNQHKHVGIVEVVKSSVKPKANKCLFAFGLTTNLIHASLEKKKVIRQSLEKVFENYNFVEAKRVVE